MQTAQKSTLAKLLATENVTVEHRKVPTAYFNLQDRKIILPIWKEMSNELYNLLIGHEVGHALNTPLEGWHDNVKDKDPGFKSFLNVIEDARIERMQKKQYPGLVKDFYAGYRELMAQDFFGVNDRDPQELPLIDRINLHYKVGSFLGLTFTDAEQVYLNRIDNAETWDDVLAIAESLYEYSKEEPEMQNIMDDLEMSSSDDEDEDMQDSNGYEQSDEQEDTEGDDTDENGSNTESEMTEDQTEESVSDDNPTQGQTQGPASITDMNFRENESNFIDPASKESLYVTFPTQLDSKKYIMPVSKTWKTEFTGVFEKAVGDCVDWKIIADSAYKSFNLKNTSYISMLVQQFEMRRKASVLARSRTNKTGELNMNKLWATKLTEDVFLSNTIVPDGKNHGMMLFVDFSGSMFSDISATIEQLLVQIAFCKKVNIPFDVYAFGPNVNDSYAPKKYTKTKFNTNDIKLDDDFQVIQLISSSLNSKQYKESFLKLLTLAEAHRMYRDRNTDKEFGIRWVNIRNLPAYLLLGGTPLAQTALVARNLIKEFKEKNRIEIMNVIFLTDGDATDELEIEGYDGLYSPMRNKGSMVIQEKGVSTVFSFSSSYLRYNDAWYHGILKHIKATLDIRLINFHIGNFKKHNLMTEMYSSNDYETCEKKYKNEWLSHGYIELNNHKQFDVFYAIKNGSNLNIDDEGIDVKSDKKGDLLRGFRKFQKNKKASRVFLSRFIDKVA